MRSNIWKVYIIFDAMFLREMVLAQSRLGLRCMHTYYIHVCKQNWSTLINLFKLDGIFHSLQLDQSITILG